MLNSALYLFDQKSRQLRPLLSEGNRLIHFLDKILTSLSEKRRDLGLNISDRDFKLFLDYLTAYKSSLLGDDKDSNRILEELKDYNFDDGSLSAIADLEKSSSLDRLNSYVPISKFSVKSEVKPKHFIVDKNIRDDEVKLAIFNSIKENNINDRKKSFFEAIVSSELGVDHDTFNNSKDFYSRISEQDARPLGSKDFRAELLTKLLESFVKFCAGYRSSLVEVPEREREIKAANYELKKSVYADLVEIIAPDLIKPDLNGQVRDLIAVLEFPIRNPKLGGISSWVNKLLGASSDIAIELSKNSIGELFVPEYLKEALKIESSHGSQSINEVKLQTFAKEVLRRYMDPSDPLGTDRAPEESDKSFVALCGSGSKDYALNERIVGLIKKADPNFKDWVVLDESGDLVKPRFSNTKIEANFNNDIFRYALLKNVNFGRSSFDNTDFSNTVCESLNFSNARTLNRAKFNNAYLEDSTFSGQLLSEIRFRNANLVNVSFKSCKFSGSNPVDFSDISADNVDFESARLGKSNFRGASIRNSNFKDCVFDGSLHSSILIGCKGMGSMKFGSNVSFYKSVWLDLDLSDTKNFEKFKNLKTKPLIYFHNVKFPTNVTDPSQYGFVRIDDLKDKELSLEEYNRDDLEEYLLDKPKLATKFN